MPGLPLATRSACEPSPDAGTLELLGRLVMPHLGVEQAAAMRGVSRAFRDAFNEVAWGTVELSLLQEAAHSRARALAKWLAEGRPRVADLRLDLGCGKVHRILCAAAGAGSTVRLTALRLRRVRGPEALEPLRALTALRALDLSGCESLTALPASLGALTALQRLGLGWCRSLAALPPSLGALTALQWLDLHACGSLTALPQSLGSLTALHELDLFGCGSLAALPPSLGSLASLQVLHLSGCVSLTALPASLGALSALQVLRLSGCVLLTALPASFSRLSKLRALVLDWRQEGLAAAAREALPQLRVQVDLWR
jgi:hypothetical protein